MHNKKLRRLYIGISSAVETAEGEGGQEKQEAEQNCEGEQDVDEVGWKRYGRWA